MPAEQMNPSTSDKGILVELPAQAGTVEAEAHRKLRHPTRSRKLKKSLDICPLQHVEEDKQCLRVLIGDRQDGFVQIFSECIEDVCVKKCHPIIKSTEYADELLGFAKECPYDLFILMLNNIYFSSKTEAVYERIEKSWDIISDLRNQYKKPIIAFTLIDDPIMQRKARKAGVSYFLSGQPRIEKITDAIEKCLNI